MPVAPRTETKAAAVAFKILGVPPNMSFKRTQEQKRINDRLKQEETFRVR